MENLLDLACGKGGDLDKWISNGVRCVRGYDIDVRSIEEANRRYLNTKEKIDINFYVKDLSKNVLFPGEKKSDIVTSMFAFHYFFESRETFNVIMSSVENNIKEGGIFMGALFDGDSIRNLMNEGDYSLVDKLGDKSREYFRVSKYRNITDDMFGNKISVLLKDTVLDKPMDEYLVYFSKFVEEMKRRGFELLESSMFSEWYGRYGGNKMNNIEKSVSFLNRTFVFKKVKKAEDIEVCFNHNNHLMECEWVSDVILEKFKKALIKKYKEYILLDKYNKIEVIMKIKIKNDFEYIYNNFLFPDEIMKSDVSKNIIEYYKTIYKMYIKSM